MKQSTTSNPASRAAQSRPGGPVPGRTGGPRLQYTGRTGTGANAGQEDAMGPGSRAGNSARGGFGASPGARTGGGGAGGRQPTAGRVLQRPGPPRPGPGQVLARRIGPGQYQEQGQRSQGQRPGTRGGARSTPSAQGPPTDRRVRQLNNRRASRTAEEEDPTALQGVDLPTRVENYVNTIVDPPLNPTTELPHTPGKDLTADELRKDWPSTPLSGTGLVESIQQRIEWLAHRLPHGYQTPNQLAMHYARGNLTRFESTAERDEVLSISHQLAQKWADRDTAKEGASGEIQPEDMEFSSLADRGGERQGLADTWVKGTYPDVQKQKMPFLDQIVRNLNNNGTVTDGKAEQFMQTVQSVIVSRQQGQAPVAASTQKAAEK